LVNFTNITENLNYINNEYVKLKKVLHGQTLEIEKLRLENEKYKTKLKNISNLL
jgi:regulator of replication initiation timing